MRGNPAGDQRTGEDQRQRRGEGERIPRMDGIELCLQERGGGRGGEQAGHTPDRREGGPSRRTSTSHLPCIRTKRPPTPNSCTPRATAYASTPYDLRHTSTPAVTANAAASSIVNRRVARAPTYACSGRTS